MDLLQKTKKKHNLQPQLNSNDLKAFGFDSGTSFGAGLKRYLTDPIDKQENQQKKEIQDIIKKETPKLSQTPELKETTHEKDIFNGIIEKDIEETNILNELNQLNQTSQSLQTNEQNDSKDLHETKRMRMKRTQKYFSSLFSDYHKNIIEVTLDMKMKSILFDSDNDDWNIETSIFDKCLLNQRYVLIFVEFEDNQKLIFFIPETIREIGRTYVKDNHKIYTIHQHSITSPINLNKLNMHFTVFDKHSNDLFKIGNDVLTIKKQSLKHKSNGSFNILQTTKTTPKRIVALHMVPLKLGIHTLKSSQRKTIEEWTSHKIKECLVDDILVELNSRKDITSIIMNRSHLLFILESQNDEGNRMFGWYINEKIEHEGFLNDPNAFIFTIDEDKQLNKYPIKSYKSQFAFWISPSFDERFIQVGMDIRIMKNNLPSSVWQDETSIYQYSDDVLHSSSSFSHTIDLNTIIDDISEENQNLLCGKTGDGCLLINKFVILQLQ